MVRRLSLVADAAAPVGLFDLAWSHLVLNSAHDSVCSCSSDETMTAVEHRYLDEIAPDYQGAVNTQYQGLLNNYNQEMNAYNNTWGTIGSLGGMLGSAIAPSIGGMFSGGGSMAQQAYNPWTMGVS